MQNAYQDALNRAKQDAKERVEESVSFAKFKAINSFDGWADYINSLEALDISEIAHESADSWDTVIYHWKAMQLCTECPISVLSEAEELYLVCNAELVGLYEMASGIAYWIVFQAVSDALQDEIDGCLELAESLQENR
jgi:hypothetical protein